MGVWSGNTQTKSEMEDRSLSSPRFAKHYGMAASIYVASGNLDFRGFEDPGKSLVQLVNSVPDLPPKIFSTGVFQQSGKARHESRERIPRILRVEFIHDGYSRK
jgi:hypothetical protein